MNTNILIVLGIFLLIGLHTIPFLANDEYRQRYGKPLMALRWSVWHLLYTSEAVLVVLILMTVFLVAGLTIVAKPLGISIGHLMKALAANDVANPQALILFFLPATVLQNVAFFLVPAAVIAGFYRTRLKDIGLPLVPPRRAVVAGLLLGVGFLLISSVCDFGLEKLARHFQYIPAVKGMLQYEQSNPVAQMATTLKKAGGAGLFWGFLAVGIAAPLGEEMLFRGFALNTLTRRFGSGWGIVLSAVLFAAPHTYSPIGLSIIFLMGLGLGYIYRTSGSLWTVILIHAVNNGTQILIAFFGR